MKKLQKMWRNIDPIKRLEIGLASVRTVVGITILIFAIMTWWYA